jgi:hypothetical protein
MTSTLFSICQSTPEEIVNSFFRFVQEEKYTEAINYLLSTNKNLENDSSLFNNLSNNLNNAPKRFGLYCGYDLIEKEETSPSYCTCAYFIKYEDNPIRVQFVFYKPREQWKVNSINIVGMQGRGLGRNNPEGRPPNPYLKKNNK